MTVLVDTSGLFALLDADDHNSAAAAAYWKRAAGVDFATHAYVASESIALVRRKLGWIGVRRLLDDLLPGIRVSMVDEDLHEAALVTYRSTEGGTSFVDRVTIEFARRRGIAYAFAFDRDLLHAGLTFPPLP